LVQTALACLVHCVSLSWSTESVDPHPLKAATHINTMASTPRVASAMPMRLLTSAPPASGASGDSSAGSFGSVSGGVTAPACH